MKRLLVLTLALLATAGLAYAADLYSENFDFRTEGSEMVGTVEGWEVFGDYAGTSTVASKDKQKALKMCAKEGGSADYDMLLTPKVTMDSVTANRSLVKLTAKLIPGSNIDLFALYFCDGEESTRVFYMKFNAEEGTAESYPEGVTFDNISKTSYNDVAVIWDALAGKVTSVQCNDSKKDCSISVGAFPGQFRYRLSTQLTSMQRDAAYYRSLGAETVARGENPYPLVPETVYIKVTEDETSIDIFNGGPDADMNYSASSDADWLTISPATGSLRSNATLRLKPKADTPEGCLKANITIDCGEYGSAPILLIYQNGYIYQEDFEGFSLGDILSQDSDWKAIYSGQGTGEISDYTVVKQGMEGGQCVKVNQITSYGGTHTTFHNTEGLSSRYDLKISFNVKFNGTPAGEYFGSADGDGTGELYCSERDGKCHIKFNHAENGAGWDFPTDAPCDSWVDISYTLNTAPDNCRLLEATIGGVTVTGLYSKIKRDNPTIDAFKRLRLFAWSPNSILVDNISLQAIPKESTDPALYAPETAAIPVTTNCTTFTIRNTGLGTIDFTATSGAGWLQVSPDSGTFEESAEITCSVAEGAEKGYYSAEVEIDGGVAGRKTVTVACQNGFLYIEDFDTLETGKSIFALSPDWNIAYGSSEDGSSVVTGGGAEGSANCLVHSASGLYGVHYNVSNSEDLGNRYNLKFTFWLKCLDWGADLWFGNSHQSLGEFQVHSDEDGGTSIETPAGIVVKNSGDLSDWTKVSYTVNTMAGNERLLECTFGDGEATDLNALISSENKDTYKTFRTFVWGGDARWAFDNFSIECVERGGSGPELETLGGGIANLGTNKVTMTVHNIGTGTMEYESRVAEGSAWLSIKEAGKAESYNGKIEGTGSQNLTLEINREALGNQYGRGKVVTTAGDAVREVLVFAQGSDSEGATFYSSDFESTELGTITEVDPAWLHPNGEVIDDNGNRCLMITKGGMTHFKARVPDKFYEKYNFRVSCKMKFPLASGDYSGNCFGTDMDHGQGEYNIDINEDGTIGLSSGNAGLSEENITNTCNRCEWFDVSYTYNADPLDRQLVSLTFGDSTYEFNEQYIDPAGTPDYGWFKEIRIYTWSTADPYYLDDIRVEAVPKSSEPPEMAVEVEAAPVSYTKNEVTFTVKNKGGQSFRFTSEVVKGAEYLSAAKTDEVFGTYQFKGTIDRSKMGCQFYRPVVRFTNDREDKVLDVVVPIQGGNDTEGYVLYESAFCEGALTTETESGLVNELSDQDPCWKRNCDHNRCDIVEDPAGSGRRVMKMVNVNDWTKFAGYNLYINDPAESSEKFDIIYDMDLYIPDTYVEDESEHPDAYFFFSQGLGCRKAEFCFYLDKENHNQVCCEPNDITNTEWWNQHKDSITPVANNTWFHFYYRMNNKLVDMDHRTLYTMNFGENEFTMEGDDSTVTYPGGISETELVNEATPRVKLWSYRDNADICMDNLRIVLVPKGLPEPALLGVLALLALAFGRKLS